MMSRMRQQQIAEREVERYFDEIFEPSASNESRDRATKDFILRIGILFIACVFDD